MAYPEKFSPPVPPREQHGAPFLQWNPNPNPAMGALSIEDFSHVDPPRSLKQRGRSSMWKRTILASTLLVLLGGAGFAVYWFAMGGSESGGDNAVDPSSGDSLEGDDGASLDNEATSTPSASPITESPTTSPTCAYVSAEGECFAVPEFTLSATNEIKILCIVDESAGHDYPVARSYGGHPWEITSAGEALEIDCAEGSCTMRFPDEAATDGGYYRLSVASAEEQPTPEEGAVRLLMQTTFGPTRETIEEARQSAGSGFAVWIKTQMEKPPTLLRAYFRERSNPRSLGKGISLPTGAVRSPCTVGSRWHEYAFTEEDVDEAITNTTSDDGSFELSIDGIVRAKVQEWFDGDSIVEGLNQRVRVSATKDCKVKLEVGGGNPAIHHPGADSTFSSASFSPLEDDVPGAWILTEAPGGTSCPTDDFVEVQGGKVYKFDPRIELVKNTLETPSTASVEVTRTCPSVPKTFLNRDSCKRVSSACAPTKYQSAAFPLNATNVRKFYTTSAKYVYVMRGLTLEDVFRTSPCKRDYISRWVRASDDAECAEPDAMSAATRTTVETAIRTETENGNNNYVIDMNVRSYIEVDGECKEGSTLPTEKGMGMRINVDSVCWEHIHPDEFEVVDATYWNVIHDGNGKGRYRLPIKRFAEKGNERGNFYELWFPESHSMLRWNMRRNNLQQLGAFGSTIDFQDLPSDVQTIAMAAEVGASSTEDDSGFEVCGSPGEVANVPLSGHHYRSLLLDDVFTNPGLFRQSNRIESKSNVWANVALTASDQFRQRTAWSLSQILVIGVVGLDGEDDVNEVWHTYYDIMVRNAFGNYRDILQEVSYSPMMGVYLTFRDNRARARSNSAPDENYAREIMQLFSIGLYLLNQDGTVMTNTRGEAKHTYDTNTIMSMARAWTGFDTQALRGNIEARSDFRTRNMLDPMRINPVYRDLFPKFDLANGHLGDTYYPLCADLPPQSFLREGAVYRYLGPNNTPSAFPMPELDGTARTFTLSKRSALYPKLCERKRGACTYPSEVRIDSNLACVGEECDLDDLRTLRIVDPSGGEFWYEYVRAPCVELTFFNDGIKVNRRLWGGNRQMCVDPSVATASPACNIAGENDRCTLDHCVYALESVTVATAARRCAAIGEEVCTSFRRGPRVRNETTGEIVLYQPVCDNRQGRTWVNETCEVTLQIDALGSVNIVHAPSINSGNQVPERFFKVDSANKFDVWWEGGKYPAVGKMRCSEASTGCTVHDEITCECPVAVDMHVVFTDAASVPSATEITPRLFIGSPSPTMFDDGTYIEGATSGDGNVKVWTHKDDAGAYTEGTIFEITDVRTGRTSTLFNKESIVRLGDAYSFRNPPHFMSFTEATLRDAEYETEAVIDSVFYHPNTAPFLAIRLIQRFTTSNPSPRYVSVVSEAFTTGAYNGVTYSGKYGDLGAAMAAIVLDREARSHVLHADPFNGVLREPVHKVFHALRALGLNRRGGQELSLRNMYDRIGQTAYRPLGPIQDAGLVSPESMLLTAPKIVGYLDAMRSLARLGGVTSCHRGFGEGGSITGRERSGGKDRGRDCGLSNEAQRKRSELTTDTFWDFAPARPEDAEATVDELDLLLTGGRMSDFNKNLIARYYASEYDADDPKSALGHALFLFFASAEFHSTNANRYVGVRAPPPPPIASQGRPYKAIVVLYLAGGADTWNLIVPHSGCSTDEIDLYEQYATARGTGDGGAAIVRGALLKIPSVTTQPCTHFGLHPSFAELKDSYNEGDVAFFANTGNLIEPMTKEEWRAKEKRLPPGLFAHNTQTQQAHNIHAGGPFRTKGILGRMVEALTTQEVPYKAAPYSLSGNSKILEGDTVPDVLSSNGDVIEFMGMDEYEEVLSNMSNAESSSVFASTHNMLLNASLAAGKRIAAVLKKEGYQPNDANFPSIDQTLVKQFRAISRVIKARADADFETERDVFYVSYGGWDTHPSLTIPGEKFAVIDDALSSFKKEMKEQGVWDNVVVFAASEFARTLRSNGQGTDHAWGGNYFVSGGSVKGGQILGKYPARLDDDAEDVVRSGGRMKPTTPWEGIWLPIAEWFGVQPEQMEKVLPNVNNFGKVSEGGELYTAAELFEK